MDQIKFDSAPRVRIINVRALLCCHRKRNCSPFLNMFGIFARHSGGWSTPMGSTLRHRKNAPIGMHRAMIIVVFIGIGAGGCYTCKNYDRFELALSSHILVSPLLSNDVAVTTSASYLLYSLIRIL